MNNKIIVFIIAFIFCTRISAQNLYVGTNYQAVILSVHTTVYTAHKKRGKVFELVANDADERCQRSAPVAIKPDSGLETRSFYQQGLTCESTH